jgi:autotransporter-associated beta strand protein
LTGGTVALTKLGAGQLSLTNSNTYAGSTTIGSATAGTSFTSTATSNGGTLNAGSAGALGGGLTTGTSEITVNNGGTLLLSGAGTLNRIRDAAPVVLGTAGAAAGSVGGTLSMASAVDMMEGNSAADNGDGIGALTLVSNSTLNFGNLAGRSTLVADSFAPGSFTLSVLNWTGTFQATGTDGSSDRLIFDVDPGVLASQTKFYNDSGAFLGVGESMALGNGMFEIVPVPEASTWAAGLLTVAALGRFRRRRLRSAR